jgi:hypothetical protein
MAFDTSDVRSWFPRFTPDARKAAPGDDDLHRRLCRPAAGGRFDRHRLAGAKAPRSRDRRRDPADAGADSDRDAGADRPLFASEETGRGARGEKLAAYRRQNQLDLALQELGRIERTLFMLDWLESPELRRRCHAGLNKSEQRHFLAQVICTFKQGRIADRSAEAQQFRASGLNLVIAAIVFWNSNRSRAFITSRTAMPQSAWNQDDGLDSLVEAMGQATPSRSHAINRIELNRSAVKETG